VSMIHNVTGLPFMSPKEARDAAAKNYPDFSRWERNHIAQLIQRKSYLAAYGDRSTSAGKREMAALDWILAEINDFDRDEVDDGQPSETESQDS
jgi:hypothetical protein